MQKVCLAAIVLATGCSGDSTVFYLATTDGVANSVVMRSSPGLERDAQVGMNEVTCLLGIGTGNINQEWDFPSTDEKVVDVGWQDGREVVAILSPDEVHLQQNPTPTTEVHSDVGVPGVRDVELFAEGFVALVEDGDGNCSLQFHDGSDAEVALEDCNGSLVTGPSSDWTYVGEDGQLDLVTPDGTETIFENPATLLAWDDAARALYAAEPGDTNVYILEEDGQIRDVVDIGVSIADLDAQPNVGRAVVAVADDASTSGGIFVIDGVTSEIVASQYTPVVADDVSASLDGRAFALRTPDQVHFYGVGDFWDASAAAWETYQEVRPRDPSD